jgi:hypothetical protein
MGIGSPKETKSKNSATRLSSSRIRPTSSIGANAATRSLPSAEIVYPLTISLTLSNSKTSMVCASIICVLEGFRSSFEKPNYRDWGSGISGRPYNFFLTSGILRDLRVRYGKMGLRANKHKNNGIVNKKGEGQGIRGQGSVPSLPRADPSSR